MNRLTREQKIENLQEVLENLVDKRVKLNEQINFINIKIKKLREVQGSRTQVTQLPKSDHFS